MKNSTFTITTLLCLTILNFNIYAQRDNPRIILEKSAEVCKSLKSIEYAVMITSDDGSGGTVVIAEATIKQARMKVKNDNFLPGYFSAKVSMSFSASQGTYSYTYTGDELLFVDDGKKEINYIVNPSRMRSFNLLGPPSMIGLPDYSREIPFEKILANSDSLKMSSDIKIFDENCYSIEVYMTRPNQDGNLESTCSIYYISKKDFLPRGVFGVPLTSTVRIIKTDFTVDKEAFNITIPKGYTEKRITDSTAK